MPHVSLQGTFVHCQSIYASNISFTPLGSPTAIVGLSPNSGGVLVFSPARILGKQCFNIEGLTIQQGHRKKE